MFIINHKIRRRVFGPDTDIPTGPSLMTHIDQTTEQALKMIRAFAGEHAEEVLRDRCQIINVWRPIEYLVEDSPLAVSDFRTIPGECLIPVDVSWRTLFSRGGMSYTRIKFSFTIRAKLSLAKCISLRISIV